MILSFILLTAMLLYVFVGFPTVMMLVARFPRTDTDAASLPDVTVLIAARNEANGIIAKLDNTLQSHYPAQQLRVIVGSDGSRDGTNAFVREYRDPRVRLLELPGHGKTQTVNALLATATTEVVVLTDADVLIAPDAIRRLVTPFSDLKVQAVCGRRSDYGAQQDAVSWPARLYNLYEGAIKRGEGRLGRTLGGDGCLYAIRRVPQEPLPPNVPDDFVNALRVLARGARVLYEERALSWEALPTSSRQEFTRKRRTIARGMRGLWSVRQLLNPLRYPLISFLLFSHKILRWGAHAIMLAILLVNIALVGNRFFAILLVAQCAFYLAVPLGRIAPTSRYTKPLRVVRYFVMANAAAVAALLDILRGTDWSAWSAAGKITTAEGKPHAASPDR